MSTRTGFEGRYFQICGSASRRTNAGTIRYAHALVAELATSIARNGGGLVLQLGKEPRHVEGDLDSPALLFDWTALEATAVAIAANGAVASQPIPPIIVVFSEKAEREVPFCRQGLFQRLLQEGRIRLQYIQPGARSAAMLRDILSRFGDIAICLGGGTGVEHIAENYLSQRKSVIPFDLLLGASREDGTGGSERLNREAKARPAEFLRLRADHASQGASLLAQLTTRGGKAPTQAVREAFCSLVSAIDQPVAFYVRLLNPAHPEFAAVERFFRDVVDSVLQGMGFRRVEVGTDPPGTGFMNVEIFKELHFCNAAVVDISGERPNCFIELGYALGRMRRVIVTAIQGTTLPFDQQAIPCFFWDPSAASDDIRQDLAAFIERHLNRPPLVT